MTVCFPSSSNRRMLTDEQLRSGEFNREAVLKNIDFYKENGRVEITLPMAFNIMKEQGVFLTTTYDEAKHYAEVLNIDTKDWKK